MPFDRIATTETRQRALDQLRLVLHQPGYARNPDQILENLDTDPLIPDAASGSPPASRAEFLDLLANHLAHPTGDQRSLLSEHCHRHGLEGPPANHAAQKVLGHVHGFMGLVRAVRGENSDLPIEVEESRLRGLIHDCPAPARLARQRFELANDRLGRYPHWSFSGPENDHDPFQGVATTREALVNRLGLGHFGSPAQELVCWGHRLPVGQGPHLPTGWDADVGEWSVCWRPGGYSLPLSGGGPGLPEVVHPPTTGSDLALPIEPLAG